MFSAGIVTTDKHARFRAAKIRINHRSVSDHAERFDEARLGKGGLQLFHERVVQRGKKLQDAVDRRRLGEGIGGIDNGLAGEIVGAGQFQRVFGGGTFGGQHQRFAKSSRFAETADAAVVAGLGFPAGQLFRAARPDHYFVTVFNKAVG
ncbi:MAG: hypothetical protein ILNGONEN_00054 [Syntrophorhabdaceae bacterium]|nr:hypothetical protein [Syntrophorhabdaceae bacterium]